MADAAPGPTSYKFEAVARFPDGREEPFIAETVDSGFKEKWNCNYCTISCPTLGERPFTLGGEDDQQALELAVEFVRSMLGHEGIVLLDDDGNETELPEFGGVSWKFRYGVAG